MRQIEEQMVNAVKHGRPFKKSNTEVKVKENGTVSVYLFGNLIWKRTKVGVFFSLKGWNTVTTRSRLNALNVGDLVRRNHKPVLNGVVIDPKRWYMVKTNKLAIN